jgi:hypothetical protein
MTAHNVILIVDIGFSTKTGHEAIGKRALVGCGIDWLRQCPKRARHAGAELLK